MDEHTFIFVGGMHRSGTTMVARYLAEHPDVSGFAGTGVPEDEGQHLQTVYVRPSAERQSGRFAFDPTAHRTESSPLVTVENRRSLYDQWSEHWDTSRTHLMEKSPPNLMCTRFLQAMFPESRFVMVIRHPIAVACATQKWSATRPHSLIQHWLAGYECLAGDIPHLQHALVVRYENLVRDPDGQMARVFDFLGLDYIDAHRVTRPDVNEQYFATWDARAKNPAKRAYLAVTAARYERRAGRFGYSLLHPRREPRAVPGIPGLG